MEFHIHFNSRPSARGDYKIPLPSPISSISIHAPPRGATKCTPNSCYSVRFQFTPLREGRPAASSSPITSFYFNSRPSARGDEELELIGKIVNQFQFTPLREGRLIFAFPLVLLCISIHAPPRGATMLFCICYYMIHISIHAPPRGATRTGRAHGNIGDFNSRPSARGDAIWQGGHAPSPISIHAPPRGATPLLIIWVRRV